MIQKITPNVVSKATLSGPYIETVHVLGLMLTLKSNDMQPITQLSVKYGAVKLDAIVQVLSDQGFFLRDSLVN